MRAERKSMQLSLERIPSPSGRGWPEGPGEGGTSGWTIPQLAQLASKSPALTPAFSPREKEKTPRLAGKWLALFLILLCLTSSPAHAHRINLFAWVEGDAIRGSVYFAGGGKARNVTIRIVAPDGKELGNTTTDARGEFTFTPTQHVDLRLIADSGDGHRAEFLIAADALAGKAPTAAPAMPPSSEPAPVSTESELERSIRTAVSREIAPLKRQLDEQESRTQVRDIVAGIGYIVGLAGLTYYLMQRKARRGGKS